MNNLAGALNDLERSGFALLQGALGLDEIQRLSNELERCLQVESGNSAAMRRKGGVYAARNLLSLCPAARQAWKSTALLEFLSATLGSQFGLVRGLFFDKPPEGNWSLPWHRDQTVAVANNRQPRAGFRKPTTKAGVAHFEAPRDLLETMLTLRIHLDDAGDQNGALRVIAGSHRIADDESALSLAEERLIAASAGDVLAMRPLLIHASGVSRDLSRRRRVLHLEFAPDEALPEGLRWHEFYR